MIEAPTNERYVGISPRNAQTQIGARIISISRIILISAPEIYFGAREIKLNAIGDSTTPSKKSKTKLYKSIGNGADRGATNTNIPQFVIAPMTVMLVDGYLRSITR